MEVKEEPGSFLVGVLGKSIGSESGGNIYCSTIKQNFNFKSIHSITGVNH